MNITEKINKGFKNLYGKEDSMSFVQLAEKLGKAIIKDEHAYGIIFYFDVKVGKLEIRYHDDGELWLGRCFYENVSYQEALDIITSLLKIKDKRL